MAHLRVDAYGFRTTPTFSNFSSMGRKFETPDLNIQSISVPTDSDRCIGCDAQKMMCKFDVHTQIYCDVLIP